MVETYRAGSSQGVSGSSTRPHRADVEVEAVYPAYGDGVEGYEVDVYEDTWPDYAPRQVRRPSLFVEDSIVLLGILLGGAAGYMAAAAVNRAEREPSRRSIGRSIVERFTSRKHHDEHYQSPYRTAERDETADLIASSKVEGTAVYNRKGEKLGEVYNFMVGKRSGRVAYAIMSFGGFLGIGQKYHPLPWGALTYDTDKKGYMIDADKERLMGAPHYGAGEDPWSRPGYARGVEDYWRIRSQML